MEMWKKKGNVKKEIDFQQNVSSNVAKREINYEIKYFEWQGNCILGQ